MGANDHDTQKSPELQDTLERGVRYLVENAIGSRAVADDWFREGQLTVSVTLAKRLLAIASDSKSLRAVVDRALECRKEFVPASSSRQAYIVGRISVDQVDPLQLKLRYFERFSLARPFPKRAANTVTWYDER